MRTFLFIFFFFCTAVSGGAGFWYWSYTVTPAPGTGEIILTIPKGTGVRTIGTLLADKGLLHNDIRFLALVYFSGLTAKLQAGEYSIPLGLTPPEVLQLLKSGNTLRHHVTIPEGKNVRQIAEIFAKDGWIEQERFLELVHDAAFAKQLGIHAPSLEGYLFPETYTLVRHETDEQSVIRMMVNRFFQVWEGMKSLEAHNHLTQHEVLTLASLVEKETGIAAERPLIAGVFLNRLDRKMRLQSDPTVSYGIPDFKGPLTKADLKRPTPYNTYVIPGLPLGPICNPGQAAIRAVLDPAEVEFLYFVSKNDGTHIFSKSLEEHNRAVQTYQRKNNSP